jgi:hypothetical protein
MSSVKYTIVALLCLFHLIGHCQSSDAATRADSPAPGLDQVTALKSMSSAYMKVRSQAINPNTKTIPATKQKELDGMVSNMKAIGAGSYEYNLAAYLNNGRTVAAFPLLEAAALAYPDNPDLYGHFLYHYELTNDKANRKVYSQKIDNSNSISSGVMEYNYNVLVSVEQGGILFTNGTIDTHPLFIWQDVKNVRNDITIINVDMLHDQDYLDTKSKEAGIKIKMQNSNYDILKWIIKNNGSKSMYLGHTISRDVLKEFKSKLYLSGLTYRYSTNPINNVQDAVSTFEDSFKKIQLNRPQINKEVKSLNANYILPLVTVLAYYKENEKTSEYQSTRKLLLKIAKEAGKETQTTQYLTQHNL